MRHIAIDTNVYSAFKKGNSRVIEIFQNSESIAVDIVVLAELFAGFKAGTREKHNRKDLEEFLNNDRVTLLTHNEVTAEFHADIFMALKKRGKPIPTNDIWIAASARQNGLFLFSLDSHFSHIDGLLLIADR